MSYKGPSREGPAYLSCSVFSLQPISMLHPIIFNPLWFHSRALLPLTFCLCTHCYLYACFLPIPPLLHQDDCYSSLRFQLKLIPWLPSRLALTTLYKNCQFIDRSLLSYICFAIVINSLFTYSQYFSGLLVFFALVYCKFYGLPSF